MNVNNEHKIEFLDFINNRTVVSDIVNYTCGSAPCSVASKDGSHVYTAYQGSRTGKGECHDIVLLADIPVASPQLAESFVIVEKGTELAGIAIDDIIHSAVFFWNGNVRVVLSVNDSVLAWRDWNPASKGIVGEGLFKCSFGNAVRDMTPEATAAYLSSMNCTGFNVFKERHDRILASAKNNDEDGSVYGFVTSSFSQPVMFSSDDGETLRFLGVVPGVCQYECQAARLDGRIYALARGMEADNFFVSNDQGRTFQPVGRVADGLCRQQLLSLDGQMLLGFPAPDEQPSIVRNGRNNFHVMAGIGADFSDYREIYHVLDPMGLIMFEFVKAGGNVYVLWSNAERFPDYVKWGAVQGKDQILFARLI